MTHILEIARRRHTAKAYDPSRRLSSETIEQVKALLQLSISSTNYQPWRFIIAGTEASKEQVAKSTDDFYPVNRQLIVDASHVVIFCVRQEATDSHLERTIAQEAVDGRFDALPDMREKSLNGRRMFLKLHTDAGDARHWMEKQVYANLGFFLLGVAALDIDATPMEGVDVNVLDEQFALPEQGLNAVFAVALGYHDPERDFNATLPKSRLPLSEIILER